MSGEELNLSGGGEVSFSAEVRYNCRCGHTASAHEVDDFYDLASCLVPQCLCTDYAPPLTIVPGTWPDCRCGHESHNNLCLHAGCGCTTYRPTTEGTTA